jgi:hypothetical protein
MCYLLQPSIDLTKTTNVYTSYITEPASFAVNFLTNLSFIQRHVLSVIVEGKIEKVRLAAASLLLSMWKALTFDPIPLFDFLEIHFFFFFSDLPRFQI